MRSLGIISFFYLFVKLLAGLATIAISLLLTKDEYAKFGVCYAVITGVAALAQSGFFEFYAVQNSSVDGNVYIKQQRWHLIKIYTIVTLVLIGLALTSQWLNLLSEWNTLILYALCVGLVSAAGSTMNNLCRLTQENTLGFFVLISCTALISAGFVSGGYILHSAEAAIKFSAGLGAVFLILLSLLKNGHDKIKHAAPYREMLFGRIILDYWVIAILGWLSGYGINIILYKITSPLFVSNFFLVYNIASLIALVAAAINGSWGPKYLADSINDYELANRKNFEISALLIFLTSGFAAITLIVFSEIGFFTKYFELNVHFVKSNLLAFALAGVIVAVPWWQIQNYYTRDGESKLYKNYVVTSSLLGLAVWIICVRVFGEAGIYFGFFLNNILKTGLFVFCTKRKYKDKTTFNMSIAASGAIIALGHLLS